MKNANHKDKMATIENWRINSKNPKLLEDCDITNMDKDDIEIIAKPAGK